MRHVPFLLILLAVLVPITAFADILVTYKTGECIVDLNGTGSWKPASVKMELTERSVIKTRSNGEIELTIDGEHISIGKDTTVSVNYLAQNVRSRKKMAWLQNLSPIFKKMIGARSEQSEMTVSGIRGVPEEEEEVAWLGEEEKTDIDAKFNEAKESYDQGEFGEAINIFKDIINQGGAPLETRNEAEFYLGSSLFQSVQYNEALPYLNQAVKHTDAFYHEPALIQCSLTNYFTENYAGAIEGYRAYLKQYPSGEFRPYALLMLLKSSRVLGKREDAKKYFSEIEKNYRNTSIYSEAEREMKEL